MLRSRGRSSDLLCKVWFDPHVVSFADPEGRSRFDKFEKDLKSFKLYQKKKKKQAAKNQSGKAPLVAADTTDLFQVQAFDLAQGEAKRQEFKGSSKREKNSLNARCVTLRLLYVVNPKAVWSGRDIKKIIEKWGKLHRRNRGFPTPIILVQAKTRWEASFQDFKDAFISTLAQTMGLQRDRLRLDEFCLVDRMVLTAGELARGFVDPEELKGDARKMVSTVGRLVSEYNQLIQREYELSCNPKVGRAASRLTLRSDGDLCLLDPDYGGVVGELDHCEFAFTGGGGGGGGGGGSVGSRVEAEDCGVAYEDAEVASRHSSDSEDSQASGVASEDAELTSGHASDAEDSQANGVAYEDAEVASSHASDEEGSDSQTEASSLGGGEEAGSDGVPPLRRGARGESARRQSRGARSDEAARSPQHGVEGGSSGPSGDGLHSFAWSAAARFPDSGQPASVVSPGDRVEEPALHDVGSRGAAHGSGGVVALGDGGTGAAESDGGGDDRSRAGDSISESLAGGREVGREAARSPDSGQPASVVSPGDRVEEPALHDVGSRGAAHGSGGVVALGDGGTGAAESDGGGDDRSRAGDSISESLAGGREVGREAARSPDSGQPASVVSPGDRVEEPALHDVGSRGAAHGSGGVVALGDGGTGAAESDGGGDDRSRAGDSTSESLAGGREVGREAARSPDSGQPASVVSPGHRVDVLHDVGSRGAAHGSGGVVALGDGGTGAAESDGGGDDRSRAGDSISESLAGGREVGREAARSPDSGQPASVVSPGHRVDVLHDVGSRGAAHGSGGVVALGDGGTGAAESDGGGDDRSRAGDSISESLAGGREVGREAARSPDSGQPASVVSPGHRVDVLHDVGSRGAAHGSGGVVALGDGGTGAAESDGGGDDRSRAGDSTSESLAGGREVGREAARSPDSGQPASVVSPGHRVDVLHDVGSRGAAHGSGGVVALGDGGTGAAESDGGGDDRSRAGDSTSESLAGGREVGREAARSPDSGQPASVVSPGHRVDVLHDVGSRGAAHGSGGVVALGDGGTGAAESDGGGDDRSRAGDSTSESLAGGREVGREAGTKRGSLATASATQIILTSETLARFNAGVGGEGHGLRGGYGDGARDGDAVSGGAGADDQGSTSTSQDVGSVVEDADGGDPVGGSRLSVARRLVMTPTDTSGAPYGDATSVVPGVVDVAGPGHDSQHAVKLWVGGSLGQPRSKTAGSWMVHGLRATGVSLFAGFSGLSLLLSLSLFLSRPLMTIPAFAKLLSLPTVPWLLGHQAVLAPTLLIACLTFLFIAFKVYEFGRPTTQDLLGWHVVPKPHAAGLSGKAEVAPSNPQGAPGDSALLSFQPV